MRCFAVGSLVAAAALLAACRALPKNDALAAKNRAHIAQLAAQTRDDPYWISAQQYVTQRFMPYLRANQKALVREGPRSKFSRGDRFTKRIALTFDDGPHPSFTPQCLKVLKDANVKATFFVVGMMAEKHPELLRAEYADGHEIANHTYHHASLTHVTPDQVACEIRACGDVVAALTGKRPNLFRPPGGDYDENVTATALGLSYTTVLWTNDPGDYAEPGVRVLWDRLMRRINNGGIILLHDGPKQTLQVLPELIAELRRQGYTLVTVGELLKPSPAPVLAAEATKTSTRR